MLGTVVQWLQGVHDERDRRAIRHVMNALTDRMSSCVTNTAGLVITATSGKKVPKVGSADCYATVAGIPVKKAAGTDMPALSGTVANATFNVYAFYMDSAGTVTSAMGTAGATLAQVVFPPTPEKQVILGFIIINPTGTGDFVGNTTALDDGTVTPNTVYCSPVGAFDPTILIN